MNPERVNSPLRPSAAVSSWLVTGGTGAIGPAIVEELAASGRPVRVLTRQTAAPRDRPPWSAGVEVVAGDARDPIALRSALAGVSHVVHAAAMTRPRTRSERGLADMVALNVESSQAVAETALERGVARTVLISSASVYGSARAGRRDESAATNPSTAYGRSKLRSEQVMRAVLGDALTVLRVSAVYAPRLGLQYRLLTGAVRSRWPIVIPNGVGHCLISDHDLAQLVAHVAVDPDCAGSVFNVSDGEQYTVAEIVDAIQTASGWPHRHTPLLPRRAAAPIEFALRHLGGAEWTRRRHLAHLVASVLDGPGLDATAVARAVPAWKCEPLSVGWSRVDRAMIE